MARFALFLSFLSLSLVSALNCRVLSSVSEDKTSILVSDGVKDGSSYDFLSLDPPNLIHKNACVHVYGFLPCADNIEGYVFQVFSFGCLLIIGEYFLSKGRSKLFVIFEVGFYGGIIFPLLTMFPRIALVLSIGLMGSREIANSMVGDNIGVTVGYTVFALTIQWGSCVVFGLSGLGSDNVQRITSDLHCPRRQLYRKNLLKNVAGASVEADPRNKKVAGIMLLTLLPFVMVTFTETFDSQFWNEIIVLITLIISASATFVYFVYSYFDIADQEKSLDHARFKVMSEVHKHLQMFSPQNLIKNGQLSQESLTRLFQKIDVNGDGKIQISEIKELTVEFGMLGTIKCDIHELAATLIAEFDKDKDGEIDKTEFETGITKVLKEYKFSFDNTDSQCGNRAEEDGVLKMEQSKKSFVVKLFSMKTIIAVVEVTLGILIVIFLANPFMMNIESLSTSAGVPSFYFVFTVIPLATNLTEALSAHFCRKKDKARITSHTFSEIYRDVTMNNLMGISIILAIVYTRKLTWNHSTEVLIIVIVGLLIGVPAYVRSTYPLWISILAFALYFFSLVIVYLHFKPIGKNQ